MAVSARLLSAVNTSLAAEHGDFTAVRSDYVVVLAALFCALICAIGLAMVARCVCLHRHLNLPIITPTPAPPPSGLSKKTLQLIPTTKFPPGVDCSHKQQTDCPICLTEFSDGDLMRILPQCGHVFHITCIDAWLVSQSSCPSCRQLVLVVARCHHCGEFSAGRGLSGNTSDDREMSRQDCVDRFLP